MPNRDAVSRSMTSDASSPLSCWSLVTSVNSGSVRILFHDARAPFIELSHVVPLQCELVLGAALACRHAQVLADLHDESGSRHAGELATEPSKHLVCGDLALCERFERHEHATGIN